jgi:hypothetical protein
MSGIYDIKPTSLYDFNRQRGSLLPVEESTSFFSVYEDENIIGKFSIDYDTELNIFRTEIREGRVPLGGNFTISGRISPGSSVVYSGIETYPGTVFDVNGTLRIDSKAVFHGTVEVNEKMRFGSTAITFHEDSILKFKPTLKLLTDAFTSAYSAMVTISGTIIIPFECVDDLYRYDWINITDNAIIKPIYSSTDNRTLSMSRYNDQLAESGVVRRTQSDIFSSKGKLGYKWVDGDKSRGYELIELQSVSGENVLGDYKLHVLGNPHETIDDRHIVSKVVVSEDSTLYITDQFDDCTYQYPELVLGYDLPGEVWDTGILQIDGSVICNYDGYDMYKNVITLVGGHISITETGYMRLTNGNKILSKNGTMIIAGVLEIDDISQISSFDKGSIVFTETGKLIIHNSTYEQGTILWTSPHGLEDTVLYRLFDPDEGDALSHVEYHIPSGIGVGIDKYVENFNDIASFYNNTRLENAVYKKWIIWEDGAELHLKSTYRNSDGVTWVSRNSDLYQISNIFKNTGATKKERLQEVVMRLKHAEFGDIKFVIDNLAEITLRLKSPSIRTISKSVDDQYMVENYYHGYLILNNSLDDSIIKNILDNPKKVVTLDHDPDTEGQSTDQNFFTL